MKRSRKMRIPQSAEHRVVHGWELDNHVGYLRGRIEHLSQALESLRGDHVLLLRYLGLAINTRTAERICSAIPKPKASKWGLWS